MEWDRFSMFTFISWLMVLISQSLGFIIGAWFSVIVSYSFLECVLSYNFCLTTFTIINLLPS